jgi:hypothetical protein
MTVRELCITCGTKYVFAPLTRIDNVYFVLSICIILCSFGEKIAMERDIKNKQPICRLQQSGQVMKDCRIPDEHAHKKFIKEEKRL